MKVERLGEKKFVPIVITLETLEEAMELNDVLVETGKTIKYEDYVKLLKFIRKEQEDNEEEYR